MLYRLIVEKKIRRSFDNINNKRWEDAIESLSDDVHHRVYGNHALGGARLGKQAVKQWFERLGRVFPTLHLQVESVWVIGQPWNTTVIANWNAKEILVDQKTMYSNRGLHIFWLRWGKVYLIEEYFDTQAVDQALDTQSQGGISEASARAIL